MPYKPSSRPGWAKTATGTVNILRIRPNRTVRTQRAVLDSSFFIIIDRYSNQF